MKLNRRNAITAGLGAWFVPAILDAEESTDLPLTTMGLCQYCGRYAGEASKRQTPPIDLFKP